MYSQVQLYKQQLVRYSVIVNYIDNYIKCPIKIVAKMRNLNSSQDQYVQIKENLHIIDNYVFNISVSTYVHGYLNMTNVFCFIYTFFFF